LSVLSFFQPAYLWALGFLSVILFLHFFRRRVVKRMDLSTLRFFPAAAVSKSRVKKLIDILLLLARLLLAAALILAFAGPHDRKSPLVALNDPNAAVYVWIDPSVSMEYAEGGASLGLRAEAAAESLFAALPPSAERYRFDHGSGRFVRPADRKSSAAADADKEGRAFSGRFGPVSLGEAADAFIAQSSRSERRAIFVALSDFQRSAADAFDSASRGITGIGNGYDPPARAENGEAAPERAASRPHRAETKAICVSLAPANPYNYSVTARGGAVNGGLSAVVRAAGADLDTTYIELTVGDLRAGQRSVSCRAGDSVTVAFDLPPAKDGAWGKVELHVSDPLAFDNRDYFTVSAGRRVGALIAGDARRNRVIGAALKASGPAFWSSVDVKEGNEITYEDINTASLVVINGFNGRSKALESFISGGGGDKGVIVALDPEREDDFGRSFLRSAGILPAAQKVNRSESGLSPVLTDTNSALWRGFPALSSNNSRVYEYVSPLAGTALARLGGSSTLVSLVSKAGSELFVVSTPLGVTRSNNLCETGFFVPFIDRLARRALSGGGQAGEEWYAGYAARNPFFGGGRSGTLYDRDGKLVSVWSGQPNVRVDRPGVYSLVSSSGEAANFAVSAHPVEGEMVFRRPDLGAGADAGVYYFEAAEFAERIGNLSNNAWSYRLWALLALVLCCEAFLWKRGGGD
jgi:hypothetical protein